MKAEMPEAVLEFKARDGAWYAGSAVFEGPFLRVHFEHFPEEEDERWLPQKFKSLHEIKKMIRPASQPMQDSQCSGLRRGAFLCVACRRPGSECFEYYDAKLQQLHRFPHKFQPDGEECCMCEFEVEWLGGPSVRKRQFVSCGDICLRTLGDIEDDPVIKDYIEEVKSVKGFKSLGNKDFSGNNAISIPEKRKAPFPVHEQVSLDVHEQSVLEDGQKGFNTSLQCGESTNQMGCCGMNSADHTEGPPLKKGHLNPVLGNGTSQMGYCGMNSAQYTDGPPVKKAHLNPVLENGQEGFNASLQCGESTNQMGYCRVNSAEHTEGPPPADLNVSAKEPLDIIQIDSDKEEESKPLLPRMKDLQSGAVETSSPAKVTESLDEKKLHVPLVDELSAHDFSGLSKEQTFSCMGNVAVCSCSASRRHCLKCESCQYEAVGFIPVAPCHLASTCDHSEWGHSKCKLSRKRRRKNGHTCALSAPCQVHGEIVHSQNGNTICSQECEEDGDTRESLKAGKASERNCFVKDLSYSQFLLVENIEKDTLPFKALRAARKVSSGALAVYIWPSLEYETTRKGYICYQDSEAADAAYVNFSAGRFIIISSKGRPWVVSRVHSHKLDWFQLYNISTAVMFKDENMAAGKEEVEDGTLLFLYKGTEEYTVAVGKQKLFMVQEQKLRICYQKFSNEERELEALT